MDLKHIDKGFLLKSLSELVNNEANRIVDSKLVPLNDVKKYIVASLSDSGDALKALSDLHTELSNTKLPVDTDKFYVSTSEDNKEEEEMKKELEKVIEEEDNQIKELASIVKDTLEKVAYLVGSKGDHKAAYIIERYLQTLEK